MADPAPEPRPTRHDPVATHDPVVPNGPSRVDLHTHSTRSDGVLTPGELVRAAAAAGVRTLALTDHDTLAGYRDVIAADAVPSGLTLIPGVEINALVPDGVDVAEGELHIIGLGVDATDDAFEAALASQRGMRRRRFERMVGRLRDLGLPIDEQVAALDRTNDDALGRPTIARALIAAGHALNIQDAFGRFIGTGCPGYVPREGLGTLEAIAAIRAAGGIASLAHFGEAPSERALLAELVDGGLAGLEVHYISFDRSTVEAVGAVARDLRLIATGGTDYHGDGGPYAAAHARLWVPPEVGATVLGSLAAPAG